MFHKFIHSISLVALVCVCSLVLSLAAGLAILRYDIPAYQRYWSGRANRPGELLYVALGDSAAQGIGASRPDNGYVGLVAGDLARRTGRTVRVVNLSVTGATLQDALREQLPQLDKLDPDLVTVEIGANDMGGYNPRTFAAGYEQLVQALPPGRSVIADMPYFGTRPERYNRNAVDASRTIRDLGRRYNLPVAGLYDELRTRQSPLIYASDLFHPNDRGYSLWHNAFQTAVERLGSG